MKKIQVFDPALCCSSGVCGVEVDQALVSFAADVAWAQQNGALVERFNLAQQPMVFAEQTVVKGLLERSGESALPVTLVDGELALAGRYPTRDELTRWLADKVQSAPEQPVVEQSAPAPSACCSGGRCC
jgi:hypothetical protein